MNLLKSYWASHHDECEGAFTVVVLALAAGIGARVLGLQGTFHYAFGMAFGAIAMLGISLVAHYNRMQQGK